MSDGLRKLRVPVETLHPNPWNPNRMNDATRRALRQSIESFGFIDPVTVREHPERADEWEILDGEHRWLDAKDAGMDSVDIVVVDGLTNARARKLTIILNTHGSPDEDELARVVKAIVDDEGKQEAMVGLAYDEDEIDRMVAAANLEAESGGVGADDVPEPGELPDEPESERGQVYELGPHRLMCGDSASIDDVMKLMRADDGDPRQYEVAHLVMADPPYNVEYTGGVSNRVKRDDAYTDERGEEYGPWLKQVIENGAAVSDDNAALHVWFAVLEMRPVLAAIAESGWEERTLIVWGKSHSTGQGFAQYKSQFEQFFYCHKKGKSPRWYGPNNETTLWSYDKPSRSPLHPVMRPVAMYVREIENHTQPGHNVLELFGGSGTTMMACEVANRRAFLMEIDPRYCDVIRKRYADLQQARSNVEWSGAV